MAFDIDTYLESAKKKGDVNAKDSGFDVDAYLGAKQPEQKKNVQQVANSIFDYVTPFAEVPYALARNAAAPYAGAIKGIAQNIRQGTNERVDRPELAQQMAYVPQNPISRQAVEDIGGALEAAKIPPYIPMAGTLAKTVKPTMSAIADIAPPMPELPSFQRMKPAEAPTSTISQRYREAFTPEPKPVYATSEQLSDVSSKAFQKAKESGVTLDADKFGSRMSSLESSLRPQGYTPTNFPQIENIFKELKNTKMPKDFTELQALREMIKNAQKDPREGRIATILKDQFDDYIANIPESDILGTQAALSKEGLAAWKQGTQTLSRLRKADIFEEMLRKAEFDKSTAGGVEQSLFNQIKSLAKDQRKLKMFAPEERAAIEQAARGSTGQDALRLMARFVPNTALKGGLAGGAIVMHPILGGLFEGAAYGSKLAAESMRKKQIENLANLMRGTVNPEWEKPTATNQELAKMLKIQGEK
jgi:hypothetical protein